MRQHAFRDRPLDRADWSRTDRHFLRGWGQGRVPPHSTADAEPWLGSGCKEGFFSIRAVVVKRFQANNSNFCRSRARASLRDQPLALPAWDQQEETEQSDSRTDRGRAIDTRVQSELVSSIVPRGTSLRWIVVLSLRQFGVRRSDCRRHFPCPAELGSITPHAMHNHGEPPCQCDDGFFLPPTLGNVHRPCLQPRPFLHAGQHDLRGLIEQRSHGLVAT